MAADLLGSGQRCGVCGLTMTTLRPAAGQCEGAGCSVAICRECYIIRGRRQCLACASKGRPSLASAAPAARAGSPALPAHLAKVAAAEAGPPPEPDWAFLRQARTHEFSFISRFRTNTESRPALPIPGSEPLPVRDWDGLRSTDDDAPRMRRLLPVPRSVSDVRAQCPVNLVCRYTARRPPLVVEAACHTDLEALVAQGSDAPPVALGPLLETLAERTREAERKDLTLVTALFAFTGWEDECLRHVCGGDGRAAFVHPDVSVCLIGPGFEDVHASPTDPRIEPYLPLYRGQTLQEEAAACKQALLDELFARDRAFVKQFAARSGVTPQAALLAANEIVRERDDVDLLDIQGAGPTLKWRK